LRFPSPGLAADLHFLHQRHAWHTMRAAAGSTAAGRISKSK
jgi:hypothetical protein